MGNILAAKVKVTGIRPLIWHHFGAEAIPLEKQERTGVAGNDPEEWRKTVLMTDGRQLYLQPTYAFGCIRQAAKHTKKKMGSIQSAVAATLQVTTDVILIDRTVPDEPITQDPTQPVYLYVCSVRNPTTKARNVRYRIAAATGWQTEFGILWDKTIVDRNQMQAVLHDAGQLVGLGDGRGIGFGRFTVNSFDVSEL